MLQYFNYKEEMELSCDVCGEMDLFTGDWHECLAESRSLGWKSFKNGSGEWENRCREGAKKPHSIDPMEFTVVNKDL